MGSSWRLPLCLLGWVPCAHLLNYVWQRLISLLFFNILLSFKKIHSQSFIVCVSILLVLKTYCVGKTLQNAYPPCNMAQCIFAAITELVLTRSKFANRPIRHVVLVTLFLHIHNQHSSHRRHSVITVLSHLLFPSHFCVLFLKHQYGNSFCNDIDVLKCFNFANEFENFD